MSIQDAIQSVQKRIHDAEKKAGRSQGSVKLIAVSKTKPAAALLEAINSGVTHFGENYVQEALGKIDETRFPENIFFHFIGALQTNKTKSIVGKFETIQSIDRIELATILNQRCLEAGVVQKILIQVKLGEEPAKGGVEISQGPNLISEILELKNLQIEGLMSLPPIEAEPESSRKFFVQLRNLSTQWSTLISPDRGHLRELSMGTTHDYTVAIEEGATMIRVGTAIFGIRNLSST